MLNPEAPPFFSYYQLPPPLLTPAYCCCLACCYPFSPILNSEALLPFSQSLLLSTATTDHHAITDAHHQHQHHQHHQHHQPSPPTVPMMSPQKAIIKSESHQYPILDFDESRVDVEIRTTVMIKNIPNKLSRDLLIMVLDQHCAEENYKAAAEGISEYDFIYLPMDFRSKCNRGYAFVNFTTPLAGWRLRRAMHGRKWAVFSSNKTIRICYARIQGKEALRENFKGSCFVCPSEKYLPAVLSPPRNGTTCLTQPSPVGKMVCHAAS